jgi:hypothetical protein
MQQFKRFLIILLQCGAPVCISSFFFFHFSFFLLQSGASEEELEKATDELAAVLGRNNLQPPSRIPEELKAV